MTLNIIIFTTRSRMKLPRESSGKIKEDFNLQLLPMRQMLHILAKLDFVDPKVFKEATILLKQNEDAEEILFEKFNNRILYDALVSLQNNFQCILIILHLTMSIFFFFRICSYSTGSSNVRFCQ